MARLFHPSLGVEYECPDDEGLLQVMAEAGWEPAPEPEPIPGHEPEPVKYAPVAPEAKKRVTKTSTGKDEDG